MNLKFACFIILSQGIHPKYLILANHIFFHSKGIVSLAARKIMCHSITLQIANNKTVPYVLFTESVNARLQYLLFKIRWITLKRQRV